MKGSGQRILLVDDSGPARAALQERLAREGYEVATAADGQGALAALESALPDLIITDLELRTLDGYEFIRELRRRSSIRELPVILVSAHHDTSHTVEGFAAGADDFVSKPLDLEELACRVERHLYRSACQKEAVLQSVSDDLTGMLNRRGLANFYARAQNAAPRQGASIAVMLADVDKFKAINDRFGHVVGDLALCAVGRALQNAVRTSDRVGRLGGDEFLLVLPGATAQVALELEHRVEARMPIELRLTASEVLSITVSLGSSHASPSEPLEEVVARADQAMYLHKARRAAQRG